MTARVLAVVTGALAVGGLFLLLAGSRSEPFRVHMSLDDTYGLRTGTDVKVAGVKVGKVARIALDSQDAVEVELALDDEKARVGSDASVAIRSANLLGQKFVDLHPGDQSDPARSGVRIPRARVTASVGLDEVYGVLDANTRTRLGIMINEAGRALTGRAADFNALVAALPQDLDRTTGVVRDLSGDNRTLQQLVARGERLVARISSERHQLTEVVRTAGGTMRSVAARRLELASTLDRAPGTLVTFRRFLDELRSTSVPLGEAARALSATAPSLATTLDSLEPFRRAASPTLREATASAPALSQLGTRAAPVLRRAQPVLGALSSLARTAPPLTTALDTGIDDLLGFVQGWARAIQSRDGPGHIFRGHVSLGPAAIRSAVSNLLRQPGARRKPRGRSDDSNRVAPSHAAPASPSSPTPPKPAATPDPGLLNIIPGAVDELLQPLTGRLPLDKLGFPAQDDQRLGPLLDYLLRP